MSRFIIDAAIAFLLGTAAGGLAHAQGVYVEGEDGVAVAAPPPTGDRVIVEREAAPPARVYGWQGREPWAPPSCGTFNYWNGEYCADARDEPSKE